MKKFFTLTLMVFACLLTNAQTTDISSMTDIVYFKDAVIQKGGTADITLMVKSEKNIGSAQFKFSFPEGITINGVTTPGIYTERATVNDYSVLGGLEGHKEVATFHVTASKDMEPGSYEMKIIACQVANADNTTEELYGSNIVSALKVQRTDIVTPQGTDYTLMASPFAVASGATTMEIPVDFKTTGYVRNIEFTIDYPEGMLTTKNGKKYSLLVNTSRFDTGSGASLTVAAANGTNVSFTNGELDLVKPNTSGNLLTIPVTLTGVNDGVYTIKFKDIKVYVTDADANDIKTVTIPNYNFSVFVGNSTTDANPILYGLYTKEVVSALSGDANVKAMLKDVATIDATSAVVKDFDTAAAIGKMCATKLLYSKLAESTYTNMYRTTTGWSSICVPFKVTSNSSIQYYEVSNTVSDGIVLKEVASVAANTPAFCKATQAVTLTQPGYIIPGTPAEGASAAGLTTKGTYSKISLADGAGYYLSGGKLYNDGATVQAFRAYLEGSFASAKELRIYLEETTGIRDITDEFSKEEIFNLQGIKMNKTQKGVNIINGKKVLVK